MTRDTRLTAEQEEPPCPPPLPSLHRPHPASRSAWLRRRGCTLTRVDYAPDDRHGPGRFVVAIVVPPRHQHRLAAGLGGIVGVVDVFQEG